MKKFFYFVLFCVNGLIAQNTINQYQYVIVPSQFSFTKENDKYRLNTLTKLLLEKYGFKALLDSETRPKEIENADCEILYADVISTGNFIRTKLHVVLKDCKDKVVYQSAIGTSKDKEYKVAYNQALRAAFQSFDQLQYHYTPKKIDPVVQKIEAADSMSVRINHSIDKLEDVFYAQPISNGYQLVDATPKVVMKIYKTSSPTTYSAVKGTTQGVLILKDNQWYFEYYQDGTLVSEKVDVKF